MEKYNYDELRTNQLDEVKMFFSPKAYDTLTKLGIQNIGDLLEKDINGELIKSFYSKHSQAHTLWEQIHHTIAFLKWKYFQIPFNFDILNNEIFLKRSGFSRSITKRLRSYNRSLCLDSLMSMVDTNDFSELYKHFQQESVDEIVSKLKVIAEYKKSRETSTVSITTEEIINLFNQLKQYYEQDANLTSEIVRLQGLIEEKERSDGKDNGRQEGGISHGN